MELYDIEKAMTKNEVDLLIESQKSILRELELSKYKAKEEINTLIESYQKTLSELNTYKWALRVVFAALLGGSIFGVMKLQDYIDNRIANRVEKIDRLYFAVSLANTGQWRDSLVEFDAIWSDFKAPGFKPTEQYKSFYYLNLLWVLASLEEYLPNGLPVGQPQWERVQLDADFIHEFMTSNRWENNDAVNNNLALCTLKYVKSDKALRSIRNYFQRAYDRAEINTRKSGNLHGLAVIDLIENMPDAAAAKMLKMAELDPPRFKAENIKSNLESYFDGAEFKAWNEQAVQAGNLDLRRQYAELIDKLTKLEGKKLPASSRK